VAALAWVAVFTLGAVLASGALAASSPSVVTGAAARISDSSESLAGTVNPNGTTTTYFFQWGLTNSYGVNGPAQSAGHGTKPVAVHQTAAQLLPGTTYHYRLVATNRYGTSVGADRTFTTSGHPPPDVATGPASGISQSGATLTGVVNPHGAQTSWYFQYGLSTGYGYQTSPQATGPGNSSVIVAYPLQGLASGTIYHYRLVATHGGNITSYGADAQFMTYPQHRPVPHLTARTAPRRLRHRPFGVFTLGKIHGPSSIPDQYACSGNVIVRYLRGRQLVATAFAAVRPDCTFATGLVFAHRHRPLSVRVKFLGNGYLHSARARAGHVRFT
jgi:hypothetical protein